MGRGNLWVAWLALAGAACGPTVVGEWDLDKFEVEIDDTDAQARSAKGTLDVDDKLDCELDIEFEDIHDYTYNIDLEGDVEDEGDGDFTLDLAGDVDSSYYGKAFDLAGPLDCVMDSDTLDCEGDLDLGDFRVTLKADFDRKN